ncbi:hypothetical protein DPEC_G00299410 [Dallia pectoralis]|uniref:Uncharacterized protein n=1 Tax=Dallia pectoralis TaxID=75939 RepID=A0ACC2FG68_DALPE|nr:hypothetical protein DPEC_G00299410 [Dallia pectoralis]
MGGIKQIRPAADAGYCPGGKGAGADVSTCSCHRRVSLQMLHRKRQCQTDAPPFIFGGRTRSSRKSSVDT